MTTSPIPKVRDDDPEDVSWALSTAATSFARGDRTETLKWLRRAAEAASEADRDARALEIAKAASELSPPSAPPPRAPSSSPVASSLPPRPPAKSAPKHPPPKPAPKRPASGKPSAAGGARGSKADETSKRGAVKPRPVPPDERTDTHVMTEVTHRDARPAHGTTDADGWPTEAMRGEELDALGEGLAASGGPWGQERTRIGAPAYNPDKKRSSRPPAPEVRVSQAVHVVLWRDADGQLRIAPRGTAVSAVTIEALLVAPGPDVDLSAWLSG